MPFDLSIDPETRIAVGVFTGTCDALVPREALSELWSMPEWGGHGVLWDVRSARIDVTPEEVRTFGQFILSNQPVNPPSRVVVVAAEASDFGVMRMLEAYREDPATDMRVMRDFDAALSWVSAARPPAAD